MAEHSPHVTPSEQQVAIPEDSSEVQTFISSDPSEMITANPSATSVEYVHLDIQKIMIEQMVQPLASRVQVEKTFAEFKPSDAKAFIVQEAMKFGGLHRIHLPSYGNLEWFVCGEQFQWMTPKQFWMCLTNSEYKRFMERKELPTVRGEYYHFNLFTTIEECCTFAAYILRDFKIDEEFTKNKTHAFNIAGFISIKRMFNAC